MLVPTEARIQAALLQQRPAWRMAYVDPRSILLFPPANPTRPDLPAPAQILPAGADLQLSRGYRLRARNELRKAKVALVEVVRADPLQIFAYGELMFVASLQADAEGVRHWTAEALRVYPRRWNPIWSFAERAWAGMDRCEASREALRRIRLDGPFIADPLREGIEDRIRLFDCPAPH